MTQFTVNGRRAVFFARPEPDREGRFRPELVIEDDPKRQLTRYDGGDTLRHCQAMVAQMNRDNGYTEDEVQHIIGSSTRAYAAVYASAVAVVATM